ncbi:hypothetical protein [Blastomonas fulva]|uniref:hypothetical protein n=1 Tax=Blastomonas fulva TaxID=1550728 RepID=UPI0025A32BAB|nr:hypothetical protein [Blastomonas fulva]MDM7967852.1 hypothetical protein [Blastomonas fulva]
MSLKPKSWRRVHAVRDAQVKLAIGVAANAMRNEATLMNNAERLKKLRDGAFEAAHCQNGAALHAQLELAQRLIRADGEINAALVRARQHLAQVERQRTAAYIDRETTSKLLDRAIAHADDTADRKAARLPIRRRLKKEGEE